MKQMKMSCGAPLCDHGGGGGGSGGGGAHASLLDGMKASSPIRLFVAYDIDVIF